MDAKDRSCSTGGNWGTGTAKITSSRSAIDRGYQLIQPFAKDTAQQGRGLMIKPQHAAICDMRIQHNHPVLLGYQQIREICRAVCLACRHDHPTVASARVAYDWIVDHGRARSFRRIDDMS